MSKITVQTHVFDLIWSLSNAEKKHLRKHYLSGNDSADFVKLFNVIDRHKGRSVEKTQRKIESITNLSRKKNYLVEAICSTLAHVHSGRSLSNQILKDLVIIDALFEKNLGAQALKLIRQNKKRAILVEDFTALIRLLKYEKIITKNDENSKRDIRMAEIDKEESVALDNLRVERKYNSLKTQIWETIKNEGSLPYLHLIDQVEEHLSTPYFHDENFAHTFNSKCQFNSAKFLLEDLKGNRDTAMIYMKNQRKLYDDYPIMKQEKKYDYLTVLNNYSMSVGRTGNLEKALEIYSKLENLECDTAYLKLKQFEYLASNKLGLIVDNQISNRYEDFIEYCEEGLREWGEQLNKLFQVVCIYNLGNHYFYSGDFKKALEYNYLVLNDNFKFRKDIQKFARLVQVIIHIELKNYVNLEYYIQSIKRYFSSQSNLYAFESWFLDFLDHYIAKLLKDEDMALDYLKSKQLELSALKSTESWGRVIHYFDFNGWFDYKLNAEPMMKSIKE